MAQSKYNKVYSSLNFRTFILNFLGGKLCIVIEIQGEVMNDAMSCEYLCSGMQRVIGFSFVFSAAEGSTQLHI
jgi:hypothetical protein